MQKLNVWFEQDYTRVLNEMNFPFDNPSGKNWRCQFDLCCRSPRSAAKRTRRRIKIKKPIRLKLQTLAQFL